MNVISICIADDHQLVRETWGLMLNTNPHFKVLGQADTAEKAILMAKVLRPRVQLLDINFKGMNGIDAIQSIRKYSPATKILGVSMHSQPTYAKRMLLAGASGYITKNSPREEMFQAILNVAAGNKYLSREMQDIMKADRLDDSSNLLSALTARELDVIRCIRQGLSSKEMAASLFISIKTAEVHRYNILRKLKIRNTAALVEFVNKTELAFD